MLSFLAFVPSLSFSPHSPLLLQMLLRCATVGYTARNEAVQWLDGLDEELWRQGDLERELGMEIADVHNRKKPLLVSHHVDFLKTVSLSRFRILARFSPSIRLYCLPNLLATIDSLQGHVGPSHSRSGSEVDHVETSDDVSAYIKSLDDLLRENAFMRRQSSQLASRMNDILDEPRFALSSFTN